MCDNEDEEDEVLDITDASIPDEIYEHGQLFNPPARWVIDLGRGEYLLFDEDGELLDLVHFK